MKLSRGVLSLLTVGLIFAGVGGAVAWRLLAEDAPSTGAASGAAALPSTEGVVVSDAQIFQGAQAVQGVEVLRDTLWIQVAGSGAAEAYRRSTVATRRAGIVEAVLVRENDFVEAGGVLIQLDTLEAALELSEARADLTLKQNDFEARMLAGGPVDDPEVRAQRERNIRLQVGIVAAESRLRRAELELELTRVTAPFSGRVADLKAVEGQYVAAGTEALTLVQLDPIRIQVGVLESGLPSLSAGRRAQVQFSALPGESFTAQIESVNPLVDREAGGMGRVTLILPNPGGRVLPGMYADARLDAEARPDRILVPREAVLDRTSSGQRRQIVFMARNLNERGEAVAEWRYVTTGARNERLIEIVEHEETSMLAPGEVVLVDGHHYLAHDTPVRLVENVFLAGGRPGR